MPVATVSLWRSPDFARLWVGRTVSLLGSPVTLLALPLVAIFTREASPIQVGLLAAVGSLPTLLFGLLAGVWVDCLRRRPVMILADIGQAVVLLGIPVGALLGVLTIEYLYRPGIKVCVISRKLGRRVLATSGRQRPLAAVWPPARHRRGCPRDCAHDG